MAEPSRIRKQLGAELRALRTLAGLSQRDVHADAPLSQAAVSRAERGEALLSRAQVAEWLRVTGADDDARDRVLALTEAVHNETRTWADLLVGDVVHLQDEAQQRESGASLIRNCLLTMVPGLLQTAEYARLLIPQADPAQRIDHAAALAKRLERQQVLYQEGRRFEFLIAEHALRWSPGPGVMIAQLDRLVSLATLATTELAILPLDRAGALGWHDFVLRQPADGGPPYVTTELIHGAQTITDPAAVALYGAVWEQLWEAAAVGDDAVALIRGLRR